MINALLHRQVMALDRNDHRFVRLRWPIADWSVASRLNAIFVAAVEFGDAARDAPIVFIRAGDDEDGKPAIAPIAVLGLVKEQNLFVEGTRWRGHYLPAVLRSYPFAIGRIDTEKFAICFDASCPALSGTEGEPMFTAQGEPTEFMKNVQAQLEALETEVQRTKLMCRKLRDLDLLKEMRYDATLPDGSKIAVDGFLMVDDAKLNILADELVLELHRNGVLGMTHAHYVSLGNMNKLLEWHVQRLAAPVAA
jgi:hypothetical protein